MRMGPFGGGVMAVGLLTTGVLACAEEGGEPIGQLSAAGKWPNGKWPNGKWPNGAAPNGAWPASEYVGGLAIASLRGTLGGEELSGFSLTGSLLGGSRADKSWVAGAGLAGAELRGQAEDGTPVHLRVAHVSTSATPSPDVVRYVLDVKTQAGWAPLCTAIPVSGRWDQREGVAGGGAKIADATYFTFACNGYAIGKCVEMGYRPWAVRGGVPLSRHHQACVRMVRADYCGTGRSYTLDGTNINVYDGLGIQSDDFGWQMEAEWDERGARRMHTTALARSHYVRAGVPGDCSTEREDSTCGSPDHFADGSALVMDEFRPD